MRGKRVQFTHLFQYKKETALDCSVANWLKFLPQNTKVAQKKSQRPEETTAEFIADLSKNGRKVAKLISCMLFKYKPRLTH
jgi:hypothetical protein